MATDALSNGYTKSTSSPNTYTRPLGGAELGPALAIAAARPHPREPIRIHIFHHLSSPLPADTVSKAFRASWLDLRLKREPDIAATFSPDEQSKSYIVPMNEADHETWLNKTFHIAPPNSTVESIVRKEQTRFDPLPTLHLIPTEPTNTTTTTTTTSKFTFTILLLISHWRTEAQGCHLLLSTLYTLVASALHKQSTPYSLSSSHTPGSELPLLTPSPGSLAQPTGPPTPSTSPSALASRTHVAEAFASFRSKGPCIELPTASPETTSAPGPGPVGATRRIYSPSATQGIVRAAKAGGVSVTAVLHAAYVRAVWGLPSGDPGNQDRWYASMMPVSIRSRLAAAAPGESDYSDSGASTAARVKGQGCWNSAQMILVTSPPPSSSATAGQSIGLLERARGLKAHYDTASRAEWLRDEYAEWEAQMGEFHRTVGAGVVTGGTPWFTGLGVLERAAGLGREFCGDADDGEGDGDAGAREALLTVEDVHGWADPLAPGCVLTVWTFRERLNVQISWNLAFHGRGLIGEVLDGMEEGLVGELGIGGLREEREEREVEY